MAAQGLPHDSTNQNGGFEKMVNLKTQRRPSSMVPFVSRLTQRGDDFPNLVRRFFGDDFLTDMLPQPVTWMPPVEVSETAKDININIELPGMTDKDIDVSFDDDVLTISGEKTEERKEEQDNKRYHLVERTFGSFRRSFTLPSNVNPEGILAEFRNGVLNIRLPKTEVEKARGRKIPVTVTK
jgi:HSP20 family molecular chaperone IbpA